ncbi:putative ABC transporter permease [Candidatus Avoscillospira sp. LCP25S3_F1]|uniref:putative ABC transporter permease n=1 Tax=Candidatus Avoscillospira sp. LCP25S3_F1 TaxID=3438825 RepID=UPI003F8E68FB
MDGYTVSQWVLFFLVYCFFGWCIESTFVSCRTRKLVNRGFLNGPVIPIYGFGAIAILFATLPVRTHPVAVFFLGMLAASVLEYFTGMAMEAIFKVRYWDYSDNFMNLNGHICLFTSLCWGALSVVLVEWIHRGMERVILGLPDSVAQLLSLILSGIFLADLAVSLKTALDLRKLLEQLEAYSEKAKEEARQLQERMAEHMEQSRERFLEKLPDGGEALQKRIESWEQAAERWEQSETVAKLRADLAAWKARREQAREGFRQRMTLDKRLLLRNNPSARSKRYSEQLRLLRQRMYEEYLERKKKD